MRKNEGILNVYGATRQYRHLLSIRKIAIEFDKTDTENSVIVIENETVGILHSEGGTYDKPIVSCNT